MFFKIILSIMETPFCEKKNLFTRKRHRYNNYRIPSLAITNKGTIIAACEARKKKSDWACTAIVARKSTDNGKTWSEQYELVSSKDNWKKNPDAVLNNPVFIIENNSNIIHFLYCQAYQKAFYMQSTDDGKTFSRPREITSTFAKFREIFNWDVIATGPGKGIHLKNGRLVVPIWIAYGGNRKHRPSISGVIYSDDRGKTWKAGDLIPNNEKKQMPNMSECYAAELSDSRVLLNIRTTSLKRRRLYSISEDGAHNWSVPKFDDNLFEPVCMASLIRFNVKNTTHPKFLFSNPDSKDTKNPLKIARKRLSIKLSENDCQTWTNSRIIEHGKAGYSDLAIGKDNTIFCLYERAGKKQRRCYYHHISIAHFNLAWLL
ncbi:MAG: exo-alpha-sialidase [Candidatus Lokiarchaeota archaeon]|nr:exo-alpha-sialidase [Candidatus Lokiarchaeota archaeon]